MAWSDRHWCNIFLMSFHWTFSEWFLVNVRNIAFKRVCCYDTQVIKSIFILFHLICIILLISTTDCDLCRNHLITFWFTLWLVGFWFEAVDTIKNLHLNFTSVIWSIHVIAGYRLVILLIKVWLHAFQHLLFQKFSYRSTPDSFIGRHWLIVFVNEADLCLNTLCSGILCCYLPIIRNSHVKWE